MTSKERKKRILAAARFPIGIEIDLRGPSGNIYYVLGLCNRIADEMLDERQREEFRDATRVGRKQELPATHRYLSAVVWIDLYQPIE